MFELVEKYGRVVARANLPPRDFKHLLAPYDTSYRCLRYIDPYDDTVFTGLQMEAFLPDWQALSLSAVTPEEISFVKEVEAFAQRCHSSSPDPLYLKYVGD